VYVLADGDSAGQQFGTTIAEQLPNAKVIPMPPGDDVNSLVVNHGRNALIERMK
jgi:DNA primase